MKHSKRTRSDIRIAAMLVTAVFCAGGCPTLSSRRDGGRELVDAAPVTADDLAPRIETILDYTLNERTLSLDVHAAWQILHGALAFQTDFEVQTNDGQSVSAVEHVLDGGAMTGWTVEPVNGEGGFKSLRFVLEEGSKTGQGHADQWLAILSQCNLTADREVRFRGETYTLSDLVRQVQNDVPRNVKQEYSWTLIGLTGFLGTDTEWVASDGRRWSIEELVRIETEQELSTSACGGSHRLIGLATALKRHREAGGEMTPTWRKAETLIGDSIERAKSLQNEDGSFSTHYFDRRGASPDLQQNLGATGHVVEFLATAMDPEQLDEPWVVRSVQYLCGVFDKTRSIGLECGALYHAAHGLSLYRERTAAAMPRDQ